jgi:hypothetical protein
MSYFVKKNSAGGSEFIGTTLKVVTACTVVYYIIHSIIKRFADNQKLQLIPFVLFAIIFIFNYTEKNRLHHPKCSKLIISNHC